MARAVRGGPFHIPVFNILVAQQPSCSKSASFSAGELYEETENLTKSDKGPPLGFLATRF